MSRTPWSRLPESTRWADLADECICLGLAAWEAERIVMACLSRGFAPREGIGIVRAFRRRNIRLGIAEDIAERFAGWSPRQIIEWARGLHRRPGAETERCPRALRREVIRAFGHRCEHCGRQGTAAAGPDGEPWAVDRRVPGVIGGRYVPENVTLACSACNAAKEAGPPLRDVRSLADMRGAGA